MAGRGNIANLKPFKPGQSGNPAGRAAVLPPEIRQQRKKNQAGLINMVGTLFLMNNMEIKDFSDRPQATQIERSVVAMIAKCREGDIIAFKYLMSLMVGNIPEHDYDGFTEEDLRILNRVKELIHDRSSENNSAG